MKTLTTMLFAVLTMGYLGTARAADITQATSVYGSYQDTDLLSEGWGLGIKHLVSAENFVQDMPKLSLGVDFRGGWLTDFDADSDLYTVESTLIAAYEVMDGMKPYIGVGIGGYFWDSDIRLDDTFAGNAVVGLNVKVAENTFVFAEGKYLYGDSDLEGFGANAGLSFRL